MYSRANTTNISELPELHDESQEIPDKFKKFLRVPMGVPPNQSGMNSHSYPTQDFFIPHPQQAHQQQQVQQQQVQQQDVTMKHQHHGSPTCLEIVDHVSSCPICSRFYKNDNIVYIIAIVMLSIICILLLKRVLNL